VELVALGGEGGGERVEHRVEVFEREQSGEAHGGGEDVVGGLAVVDVVVGMDDGVAAEGLAEDLIRPVGDDLVRVHVEADAGAGLEDVDGELVVMVAVDDLLGGGEDGVTLDHGEEVEGAVGSGGGHFDHGEGADELRVGTHAADGEVVDGADGLRAVEGVDGDVDGAEGVFFVAG